jgi:hypothetical protein
VPAQEACAVQSSSVTNLPLQQYIAASYKGRLATIMLPQGAVIMLVTATCSHAVQQSIQLVPNTLFSTTASPLISHQHPRPLQQKSKQPSSFMSSQRVLEHIQTVLHPWTLPASVRTTPTATRKDESCCALDGCCYQVRTYSTLLQVSQPGTALCCNPGQLKQM